MATKAKESDEMTEEYLPALRQCVLFCGVEGGDLLHMLGCLAPRTANYPKGGLVASAGDTMKEIGIVVRGAVAVTKETPQGERIVLNKMTPGGIFGEVAALSAERRAPATIFAVEDSAVLYLMPERIFHPCRDVCRWHTRLIANLVRMISDKALYLNRKIDYLAMKSMRGKLCTYLYEWHGKTGKTVFSIPLNRNELADFLNVSRPSMSRELGRMRDEGILSFSGNRFEILNLSDLERYVE